MDMVKKDEGKRLGKSENAERTNYLDNKYGT